MVWDVYFLIVWVVAMVGVLIFELFIISKRFLRLLIWKDFIKFFRMFYKIIVYECLNIDYIL